MYEIKDGMKLYQIWYIKEVRIIIKFFLIVENKYYECFNANEEKIRLYFFYIFFLDRS